jgi:hypothetical protein
MITGKRKENTTRSKGTRLWTEAMIATQGLDLPSPYAIGE